MNRKHNNFSSQIGTINSRHVELKLNLKGTNVKQVALVDSIRCAQAARSDDIQLVIVTSNMSNWTHHKNKVWWFLLRRFRRRSDRRRRSLVSLWLDALRHLFLLLLRFFGFSFVGGSLCHNGRCNRENSTPLRPASCADSCNRTRQVRGEKTCMVPWNSQVNFWLYVSKVASGVRL